MEAKTQETADTKRLPRPPALPWKVRLQIFMLISATDISQRRDGTINRFLFSLADRPTPAKDRPDRFGVRSADVTVKASRGLWARVFSPSRAASPLPVIVYIHGGGFALLSAASGPFDALCRQFCHELGAVVVSINYRLAPEHRHPAAYDDGVDVLHYLSTTRLADLDVPVDFSRCFIAGDSAGGNIVHHVAQRWTTQSTPSSTPLRLAGIVLLQPYFGGEERTEAEKKLEGVAPVVNMRRSDWSWKAFLPEGADRDHPAAHVTEENTNLAEGFPPAMVVVGGLDPLQDWQRGYVEVLRGKGKAVRLVEFPEAIHGFYIFPELADSGNLINEMKAFMGSNTSESIAENSP